MEMDKQMAGLIKEKDDFKLENQVLKDKILKLEEINDTNTIELQKLFKEKETVKRE